VLVKLYPLVFSFRDLIAGNGFVAAVAMDGHVLLSEEEGGFWMYGVQPGSIAAGAELRDSAFKKFKDGYLSVLFDMAAEATSFEAFELNVKSFFAQVNAPNAKDWAHALAEVRASNIELPNLAKVPAGSKSPTLTIAKMTPERANSGVNEFSVMAMAEGPAPLPHAA
jgi:hypothetical protein